MTGEGGIPQHSLYDPAFFAIVGKKSDVTFLIMLQEGGPLPGPETRLLSNARK